MYAIIDIETTGSKPSYDRITEIAIVIHDGEKIIENFSTLINPERFIPYFITELTGISNEMVQDAPKFYEVAKKITEYTNGNIFVAHNVRFDYSFVKAEFAALGYNFSKKTLCTVRLSRKLIPGQLSYSLGKLCHSLGIPLKNRHRALGDAEATAILFDRLLKIENPELQVAELVKQEAKAMTLPPFLNKEIIDKLPAVPGVYYFHDEFGNVIYVGKSKSIRNRIIQHFGIDIKSRKAVEFKGLIHDVSYERTGNELVALLLESDEIKRLKPRFNSQQKRNRQGFFGIFQETDEAGYNNLFVERLTNMKQEPLTVLENGLKAKDFLLFKMLKYRLCEKKCKLYHGKGACFYFHLHQCNGACLGQEAPEDYNQRVQEATDSFSFQQESMFIVGNGRFAG
ncbi:MAG: 3'-5' exoribonuclease, partial [Verrucomicrobia bacterium]|nr:3'-5' exoribonuclease [Cytophagales bacterium]